MQNSEFPRPPPPPNHGRGPRIARTEKVVTSREEIARREVGHTDISRRLSRTLTVVFLLTIVAVPAVQFIGDLGQRTQGTRDSWLPQSMEALRLPLIGLRTLRSTEGGPVSKLFAANRETLRALHAFENSLEERSLVGGWLRPRVLTLLTGVLDAGNEQVYCGRNKWLFYRSAVDHLTAPGFLKERELERRAASGSEWQEPPQPNPLLAISEFRDQLAERGIELLLMPIPVKATIYPEVLSHRYADAPAPIHNPSLPEFLTKLEARGVRVVDPTAVLWEAKTNTGESVFLTTDTHWTPQAVDLVGAHLAEVVNDVVDLSENDTIRYTDKHIEVSRVGDLTEMLELPALYPPQTVRISPVRDGVGTPWQTAESAEVLLLGDSFANIFAQEAMGWGTDGGLAQRLSYHLQRPVNALIRNDDGAFATRLLLSQRLSDGDDLLANTRIVIWEFTSRELSLGDWRSVPLGISPSTEDDFFVPARGAAVVVEGTIAALAEIPNPKEAPYADYIVGLHLVDLSSEFELDGTQALVFAWAMKERRLTTGARYLVGQRIRLELRPWADVNRDLESVSRGELYDHNLLLQTPCWGVEVTH